MNKKIFPIVIFMLVIAMSYFFFGKREVASSTLFDENSARHTENSKAAAKRIASLENKLKEMSNQVSTLTKLVKKNSLRGDDSTQKTDDLGQYEVEADYNNVTGAIDPFSAEGIALENEIQNNYISQVDGIYNVEEVDPEWAQATEGEILSKLNDIDSFATFGNLDSNSDGTAPTDVAVSNFECRSNLCGTEIITGTLDEMLAYQSYMVDQTKHALPSIVFSTIEPYGNKFRMKAYLARDEYEFPAPSN